MKRRLHDHFWPVLQVRLVLRRSPRSGDRAEGQRVVRDGHRLRALAESFSSESLSICSVAFFVENCRETNSSLRLIAVLSPATDFAGSRRRKAQQCPTVFENKHYRQNKNKNKNRHKNNNNENNNNVDNTNKDKNDNEQRYENEKKTIRKRQESGKKAAIKLQENVKKI